MRGNRIFRGCRPYSTITDRWCNGSLLPGTAVFVGPAYLTQANSASGGLLALLDARDYMHANAAAVIGPVEPLYTPYNSGESGVAIVIEAGDRVTWAMAAGTYTPGQELTVTSGGRLGAASSGQIVVAHFDVDGMGASFTVAVGQLVDVVVSHFYARP